MGNPAPDVIHFFLSCKSKNSGEMFGNAFEKKKMCENFVS